MYAGLRIERKLLTEARLMQHFEYITSLDPEIKDILRLIVTKHCETLSEFCFLVFANSSAFLETFEYTGTNSDPIEYEVEKIMSSEIVIHCSDTARFVDSEYVLDMETIMYEFGIPAFAPELLERICSILNRFLNEILNLILPDVVTERTYIVFVVTSVGIMTIYTTE